MMLLVLENEPFPLDRIEAASHLAKILPLKMLKKKSRLFFLALSKPPLSHLKTLQ